MVNAQAGSMQHTDRGTRWVTAITSLMVGTAFFALWFWLLPSWLGFQTAGASALGWRWIAGSSRCSGSAWRCDACGTLDGQATEHPHRWLPQRNSSWWGSMDTCGIRCTWVFLGDGQGCGWSLATRIGH